MVYDYVLLGSPIREIWILKMWTGCFSRIITDFVVFTNHFGQLGRGNKIKIDYKHFFSIDGFISYMSSLCVTEAEVLLRMYSIDRLLPFMIAFDGMDDICCGLKEVTSFDQNYSLPVSKKGRSYEFALSTTKLWINEQLYQSNLNTKALQELLFGYIENIIGLRCNVSLLEPRNHTVW